MRNVDVLLKVKQHILENPARLRMAQLLMKGPAGKTTWAGPEWGELDSVTFPECGTVGCIAGWLSVLGNFPSGLRTAESFLDLPNQDMFYVCDWPVPYKLKYYDATDQQTRANIVGEVIDYYIKEYTKDEVSV